MSVAFRRESDEEHLEPKFERPIAPGPNLVTARGLALIEAEIAGLDSASDDAAKRDRRYWHTRKATAVVTSAPGDGSVGFGSDVRVRMGGNERRLHIVGGDEAAPAAGLIGFHAPLARALMGACEGDAVPFAGGTIEVLEVTNGEG